MSAKKRIVIIGSSFAGYTTALSLSKLLDHKHEIIVIDRSPEFMFLPSLVWHPFGYRTSEDISFDTRPIYKDLGITFIETVIYGFDLAENLIYTPDKDIPYDYLVIATGTKANYSSVKGFVPGDTAYSICSFYEADKTRAGWKKFLQQPGTLVIGAAQYASYFFAAYEFLLNALFQLKDHKLLGSIDIHFITAEPYLTHFGVGGIHEEIRICEELFERYGVKWYTNEEIHELKGQTVILESGQRIDSSFTMVVPQFIGADAITTTRKFSEPHGLLVTDDKFRHVDYPNIYAAGSSVFVPQKEETAIPCGFPRTRSTSEAMARAVARNIYRDLEGGDHVKIPYEQLYEYSKKDMSHIAKALFHRSARQDHDLDFIAKSSQEKWANLSIEKYIEASFDTDFLKI